VDDGRRSPIEAADALGGRARDREVVIDTHGCPLVPQRETFERGLERVAQPGRHGPVDAEVGPLEIEPARGRVAVADVHGALGVDAVRPPRRAREHEVVPLEVQARERDGIQHQQRPEGIAGVREVLQERRAYVLISVCGEGPLPVVDAREDRSVREQLVEREYDALRASPLCQIVMDDGNAHTRLTLTAVGHTIMSD
jgi:hypothetical protein